MKGFQPTLCTVGGFVAGTAALRILLRGATNEDDNAVDTRGGEENYKLFNEHPRSDLYEWAYDEHNDLYNDPPERSLLRPPREHSQDIVRPGTAVSRRMNLFDSDNNQGGNNGGFRLKLYWRDGYYWQESSKETFWCMSCKRGSCKKNEVMRLVDCKTTSNAGTRFELIKKKKGNQYRVAGANLCLQKRGGTRIALRPCSNSLHQLFKSTRGREGSFDLRPAKYNSRCLTNHHHPKAGEIIFAESCKKAHRTKTGYWVQY